jgi:hypothetical protein
MRDVSAWNEVVGVEKTMFELVEYDQERDLVVWLAFGPRGGRELMRVAGRTVGSIVTRQRRCDSADRQVRELLGVDTVATMAIEHHE